MAQSRTPTKLQTAKRLAQEHLDFDPGVQRVFLLEGESERSLQEPIKLLEVVDGTVEAGIEPVGFPPSPRRGLHYSLVIVDVSPREFRRIRNGVVRFNGTVWKLGQELSRR